jgi:hypothetical protein
MDPIIDATSPNSSNQPNIQQFFSTTSTQQVLSKSKIIPSTLTTPFTKTNTISTSAANTTNSTLVNSGTNNDISSYFSTNHAHNMTKMTSTLDNNTPAEKNVSNYPGNGSNPVEDAKLALKQLTSGQNSTQNNPNLNNNSQNNQSFSQNLSNSSQQPLLLDSGSSNNTMNGINALNGMGVFQNGTIGRFNTNLQNNTPNNNTTHNNTSHNNTAQNNSENNLKNPVQSFYDYSQAVQIALQAFQSVTQHSLTLLQALLMFKHELSSLFFGTNNFNQNFSTNFNNFNQNNQNTQKSTSIFYRLVTKPIAWIVKSVITIVDVLVRLLTANMIKIRTYKSKNSLFYMSQHFNSNSPTQIVQNNFQNEQIANLTTDMANSINSYTHNIGNNQTHNLSKHSSNRGVFSTKLTYFITTAIGLYFLYSNTKLITQSLESRFNISSQPAHVINAQNIVGEYCYGAENQIKNGKKISHRFKRVLSEQDLTRLISNLGILADNSIDLKLNELKRSVILSLLQNYNLINDEMLNFYFFQPESVKLPNCIMDLLNNVEFGKSKSNNFVSNLGLNNQDEDNITTQPLEKVKLNTIPSLFDHFNTNTHPITQNMLKNGQNFSSQIGLKSTKKIEFNDKKINEEKIEQNLIQSEGIIYPQFQPKVFKGDNGFAFSVDPRTGQIVTLRDE